MATSVEPVTFKADCRRLMIRGHVGHVDVFVSQAKKKISEAAAKMQEAATATPEVELILDLGNNFNLTDGVDSAVLKAVRDILNFASDFPFTVIDLMNNMLHDTYYELDKHTNALECVKTFQNMGKFQALKKLYMAGNMIEYLPDELETLPNLRVIDVRDTPLMSLPRELAAVPRTGSLVIIWESKRVLGLLGGPIRFGVETLTKVPVEYFTSNHVSLIISYEDMDKFWKNAEFTNVDQRMVAITKLATAVNTMIEEDGSMDDARREMPGIMKILADVNMLPVCVASDETTAQPLRHLWPNS